MQSSFWDERYGATDFAYGEAPNVFISQAAQRYLTKPVHCVELASGEGRNVAYIAKVYQYVAVLHAAAWKTAKEECMHAA